MIQLYRTKTVWIFNYAIYGERHSGTNFLEQSMSQTFGLPRTEFHGYKHFFGFAKPERIWYERHTLFIGIVRDPYDWLISMNEFPHNVPNHNRYSLDNLWFNEWYSIQLSSGKEILEDRNFETRPNLQRYKNIFEMRKIKLKYLYEQMPLLAQNYLIIRYEDFVRSHRQIMKLISDRFDLKVVGDPPQAYKKDHKFMTDDIKKMIEDNIDWDMEANFGYFQR